SARDCIGRLQRSFAANIAFSAGATCTTSVRAELVDGCLMQHSSGNHLTYCALMTLLSRAGRILPAVFLVSACMNAGPDGAADTAGSVNVVEGTSISFPSALQLAEQYRASGLESRRFTHTELWTAMAPALQSPALSVKEIGRSLHGREIRAVTFGSGPTTVLLWSQMHGDETTASMSLAD